MTQRGTEQRAAEEAEAARKRQEEERVAEQRRQRELERAAIAEEARKKAQREQEAEEHARLRSQAKTVPAAVPRPTVEGGGWRARAAASGAVPARSESPAPSPVLGPPKIGTGGGWRQREKEKAQGSPAVPAAVSARRVESPVVTHAPLPEVKKDADGFETVPEKRVWRSKRVQNQS